MDSDLLARVRRSCRACEVLWDKIGAAHVLCDKERLCPRLTVPREGGDGPCASPLCVRGQPISNHTGVLVVQQETEESLKRMQDRLRQDEMRLIRGEGDLAALELDDDEEEDAFDTRGLHDEPGIPGSRKVGRASVRVVDMHPTDMSLSLLVVALAPTALSLLPKQTAKSSGNIAGVSDSEPVRDACAQCHFPKALRV